MKKQNALGLIILLIFIIVCGCAEFPSSFNTIENNKVRLIDFIYDPPEAAPGDSVTLLALFSGDTVLPQDIQWKISYNIGGNNFNLNIALDTIAFDTYRLFDTTFSQNTSCVGMRFKVREDAMLLSSMIPEDIMKNVPDELKQYIPQQFQSMDKKTLLGFVEALKNQPIDTLIQPIFPFLMQILTCKIRIFATVTNRLNIKSDYTVRYNSYFTHIPSVRVNTNPTVNRMGIYKVTGENLASFNPQNPSHPFQYFRLFGTDDDSVSDIVTIDKGFSYFAAVETANFDTVTNIVALTQGLPSDELESHFTTWFYRFKESEMVNVSFYDLMSIVSTTGGTVETLYPAKSDQIKQVTLWAAIDDFYLNERWRPSGSTVKEVQAIFTYTQAYLDNIKKD